MAELTGEFRGALENRTRANEQRYETVLGTATKDVAMAAAILITWAYRDGLDERVPANAPQRLAALLDEAGLVPFIRCERSHGVGRIDERASIVAVLRKWAREEDHTASGYAELVDAADRLEEEAPRV